jgi:hypothetical protein
MTILENHFLGTSSKYSTKKMSKYSKSTVILKLKNTLRMERSKRSTLKADMEVRKLSKILDNRSQKGGYPNRGYQNKGYGDRGGYENKGYQKGYRDKGYQDKGYQNKGYQDKGYQNKDYHNKDFHNNDFQNKRYGGKEAYGQKQWGRGRDDRGRDDRGFQNRPKYNDIVSMKDPDTVSQNSLSGFGQNGPRKFFNPKKEGIDTQSLHNLNKQNPIEEERHIPVPEVKTVDQKTPTEKLDAVGGSKPIKDEKETISKEKTSEVPKELSKEEKSAVPELQMKRRDTDNEFEVSGINSNKSIPKEEPQTLVNKVDSKLSKPNTEEKKEVLVPRHSHRGARGNRKPMANYYRQIWNNVTETHIDPQRHKEGVKKPTLIGDRPETDKYDKQASYQKGNYTYGRGGYNKEGYNNRR